MRHFFGHYEHGGIEGDAGCAYSVTKDGKKIVSILEGNLDAGFGRTRLCNFFLTELLDTFVCCFTVDNPVFWVLKSETETTIDVRTVMDHTAIDLRLGICVEAKQ